MSDNQYFTGTVLVSPDMIRNRNFKQVIVLYEEELLYIGDCCVRFDKLRYFRAWLNNAAISINFSSSKNEGYYKALLHNNPYIDSISALAWEQIDFRQFEAVICITQDEQKLLDFLNNKYQDSTRNGEMKLDVFVFPLSETLKEYVDPFRPGELFISNEEQEWADNWLVSEGYQQGERLFIMVDSSSSKEKLLNTVVYFDILRHLLNQPDTRLLVFDERNIGKEEFYREWVGDEGISKMIFSTGRSLRDNLCLIGSSYTKMVFGPCTGLLHCASGIFNNYLSKGMPPDKIPVLITYTGIYPIENQHANLWWGNCPLINCIMLKKVNERIKLTQLCDLSPEEKEVKDSLPCTEYTAGILIDYVDKKLNVNGTGNEGTIDVNRVKEVLVVYEEELPLLGDSCVMLDKLKYLGEYLKNASFSVNFARAKNDRFYEALLKNNPYISRILRNNWQEINFEDYDLVICVAYEEDKLQVFLEEAYGELSLPVYSMSGFLLKPAAHEVRVFPVLEDLMQYLDAPRPGELYITDEERQWADSWLESKGLGKDEQLFIVVDSSAVRSKLLHFNVYFEMLKGLLDTPHTKILIFDERRQGKREFYKGWLGEDRMSRMIFSEGSSLREDLCLLGSSYTRLVLGPCTGLMHCASGIFNHYRAKGMESSRIPLLVVYTGMCGDESYNVYAWWGASPLVNCLMLKQQDNQKKMVLLSNLPAGEMRSGSTLPCTEYTAEMLLGFINSRLSHSAQDTLKKIIARSQHANMKELRNVLLLYEEKTTLLGDSCIKSDKFRYFKYYLNAADIYINFTNKQNQKFYEGLLKNNPYVSDVSTLQWDDIRFEEFEAVICIAYNEDRFLEFLHNKYGEQIASDQLNLLVYSMSKYILRPEEGGQYIFPENAGLFEYMKEPRQGELYISKEEQEWANHWLESKGIKEHEKLFIMLDSSAVRSKLMNIGVYFDLLKYVLQMEHTKVLIFDEQNMGKDLFYRDWLGDEAMEKLIFSRGLSLREDLCLIGSSYTATMFGPCTGLMHCASSIFNNYLNNGMDPARVPLLIVYTGWYGNERYDVNLWWENSPLINCLLLKEKNNEKQIVLLADLSDEEKQLQDSQPCTEYTADMFVRFIARRIAIGMPQLTV